MAAKIIVLGVIGVIGFFVVRDYHRKKKFTGGKKAKKLAPSYYNWLHI